MNRRNTAWLDYPRYWHLRKEPAWYNRDLEPLFISGPSIRMEKITNDERDRQWHQNASTSFCEESENSCFVDALCPCVSYSRTSQRLRSALNGKDATIAPQQSCFSPDCIQYCICCPFYGCLVAKLQTTVRAFYDIDGTDEGDWRDGCFCPGPTLARNDYEIRIREIEHNRMRLARKHELLDPPSQYTMQDTMSYTPPSKVTSSTPSSSNSNGRKAVAERRPGIENNGLDTIVEANRELFGGEPEPLPYRHEHCAVTTAIPSPQRMPKIREKMPEKQYTETKNQTKQPDETPKEIDVAGPIENEATDAEQPSQTSRWPLLQYLGEKWLLVPAGKENENPDSSERREGSSATNETEHQIDVVNSEASATPTPAKHSISQDRPFTTAIEGHAAHGLGNDPLVAMATKAAPGHALREPPSSVEERPANATHDLSIDAALTSQPPVSEHHLGDDAEFHAPKPTTRHNLVGDLPTNWQEPKLIAKHRLEAHGAIASEPGHVATHPLQEDTFDIDKKSKPTTKHPLESYELSAAGVKSEPRSLNIH